MAFVTYRVYRSIVWTIWVLGENRDLCSIQGPKFSKLAIITIVYYVSIYQVHLNNCLHFISYNSKSHCSTPLY